MSNALFEEKTLAGGEEDVSEFLRQVRRYPRLTPEEERELALRCAAGDEDAIRRMVNANLRLVVSVAREYGGRGVPLLDLVQEGSIGLIAAAKKFDPSLDFRFSTYATKWIRQGVTRCILNHAGLIRVPRHTLEQIRRVMTCRATLLQRTGEEPDTKQLAAQCGFTEEKTEQLLSLMPQVVSLDATVGEEEGSLLQFLEDTQTPQPQEELVRRELKNTLESMLDMLDARQRQILRLRFGMDDGVCRSLSEVAAVMHISKERVRQIERQAMDRLHTLGAGFGLEDFLE